MTQDGENLCPLMLFLSTRGALRFLSMHVGRVSSLCEGDTARVSSFMVLFINAIPNSLQVRLKTEGHFILIYGSQ